MPRTKNTIICYSADAHIIWSTPRLLGVFSLNGVALFIHRNTFVEKVVDLLFARRLMDYVRPMSLRKPRKPIGDLGTRGTAQSPWGERGPHTLFCPRAVRAVNVRLYGVFFLKYLKWARRSVLRKRVRTHLYPGHIGSCPSNVPPEAKEAYRRPWLPGDRAKAHWAKRPYALFPAAHDYQRYNHDINWIT